MLRDYQQQAVDEIRAHFLAGRKKVLLHLATGGGKTHVFSHILKSVSEKGTRGIMVVRGRKLVEQAHQRLVHERVPHGVCMSGHWLYRPSERIQICSVDTLHSRRHYPMADVVVIDEVHMATGESYQLLARAYAHAYFLGVSATPYSSRSISHVAEHIVRPTSIVNLINEGWLVPPRAFRPRAINVDGVKTSSSTGDYVQDDLSDFMDKPKLVGDIVEQWKKLGENRPTVCFAVSIRHSISIRDSFIAAGVPCEHIDADSEDWVRNKALEDLGCGKIKVVTNVGILSTGVDMPWLGCLILARPTKSYTLYAQQMGRGTRSSPGKQNFIVLDHADNLTLHGSILEEPPASIDGKFSPPTSKVRICRQCFLAYLGNACPEGCVSSSNESSPQRMVEVVDGELVEEKEFDLAAVKAYAEEMREVAKLKGYKEGWIWHQVKIRYGPKLAALAIPVRGRIPSWYLRK